MISEGLRARRRAFAVAVSVAIFTGAILGAGLCSFIHMPAEDQTAAAYAADQAAAQAETIEYIGSYTVTAYCACEKCCNTWADNRPIDANGKEVVLTASGAQAAEGRTAAVDPEVIPYGTKIIIAGHEYIAEDCGGAIKGSCIDLYFDSHADALAYGKQTHDIYTKKTH